MEINLTSLEAIVLGVVEGLSEFLPISSTGHLILASTLMKLKQTDAHKVFEVTIQSGAMLAVVYIYRSQLAARSDLLKKLCFAFFPTGVLGYPIWYLQDSCRCSVSGLSAVVNSFLITPFVCFY